MNSAIPLSIAGEPGELARRSPSSEVHGDAVSWGAILAGAAAAAVLSLILLILGTGLGFSAASPWSQQGLGADHFGIATILWLTFTQVFASGLGGYLAGRLRTRWTSVHEDEVYFRDTAHGFLAWTIASLSTAALLTSAIGAIVGGAAQTTASAAAGVAGTGAALVNSELATPDADSTRTVYFMDSLFRAAPTVSSSASAPIANGEAGGAYQKGNAHQLSEVTRIFMNTLRTGPLSPEDVGYTAQIVAQRTGLSQQEAEKRVNDIYARMQARFSAAQIAARVAAEKARKASTYAALWLFVSLLAGAFVASWTAIYGGRQRDV